MTSTSKEALYFVPDIKERLLLTFKRRINKYNDRIARKKNNLLLRISPSVHAPVQVHPAASGCFLRFCVYFLEVPLALYSAVPGCTAAVVWPAACRRFCVYCLEVPLALYSSCFTFCCAWLHSSCSMASSQQEVLCLFFRSSSGFTFFLLYILLCLAAQQL